MRLKRLEVQGFRGFHERRELTFDDRLTLIYGPNSCGKTSISEALEWLLFGHTSKVQKADSKEEYKGAYRNCHLTKGSTAYVEAVFLDRDGNEQIYMAELTADDECRRSVNGVPVKQWPVSSVLSLASKPFILQHALKDLLHAKPAERFQGFAEIMGLEVLDLLQAHVVALATKPESALDAMALQICETADGLISATASRPRLAKIASSFSPRVEKFPAFVTALDAECRSRVPPATTPEDMLAELLKIRDDAIAKFFHASLAIQSEVDDSETSVSRLEDELLELLSPATLARFSRLRAVSASQSLIRRAEFFGIGMELWREEPANCPFCSQEVTETVARHIREAHADLVTKTPDAGWINSERIHLKELLQNCKLLGERIASLTTKGLPDRLTKPDLEKLEKLFGDENRSHHMWVLAATEQLDPARDKLEQRRQALASVLLEAIAEMDALAIEIDTLERVGSTLLEFVQATRGLRDTVSRWTEPMSAADRVLRHQLDRLAGTEDVSLLIEIKSHQNLLEKAAKIKSVLASAKDLRTRVEAYVADVITKRMDEDLTDDVMRWYDLLKTSGDPLVHFDGFEVPRTKGGKLKARRIGVKAVSYGQALPSAVATLSESKLNALGLAISIATSLRSGGPFDFLIIDDPIQSWDSEHEEQFVEVVRHLVADGKQIVLLSHNLPWLTKLKAGCQSIRGRYFQITGYNVQGPHFVEVNWSEWRKSLDTIDGILKDPTADPAKLRLVEGEYRIILTQLTAEIYAKTKKVKITASGLNGERVRKLLLECGVEMGLVDRIGQMYTTVDDAHHDNEDYAPDRERLRRYHGWSHELAALLKKP